MEDNKNHTLFCKTAYTHLPLKILAHVLWTGSIVYGIYFTWRLFRVRDTFPIRERAPRVSIAHSIVYLMLLIILYSIEIFGSSENRDWDVRDQSEIPASRRLLKATYLSIRTNIYLIFLGRISVIYFNWKGVRISKTPQSDVAPSPYQEFIVSLKQFLSRERNCVIVGPGDSRWWR